VLQLAALVSVFGVTYGGVMGAFPAETGPRLLQMLYSGVKVPILLLGTFVLSLPSFFVLNTLFGVREDFPQATKALVAAQAGLTIVLASLSPLTAFWYASSGDYQGAILWNGLMFLVATISGQTLLRRFYGPLLQRNRRHRLLLRVWVVLYAFVAIQMAWVLRPFVGDPNSPTRFFREGAWGNAYERLFSIFWSFVAGG
jgi:hypothetical protein